MLQAIRDLTDEIMSGIIDQREGNGLVVENLGKKESRVALIVRRTERVGKASF